AGAALRAGVPIRAEPVRRRLAGVCNRQVAEQLSDPLVEPVAEVAADADDHSLRPVPVVDVAAERLPLRAADRLLAPDDVPAERLVAVEELLVHGADEVARRGEVHVPLLDDHARLSLD